MIIDLALGILFSLSATLLLLVLFMYLWARYKKFFIKPTNNRKWRRNQALMPTVVFNKGDSITIKNIRDTEYISYTEYTPKYFDQTIMPSEIVSAKVYTAKLPFPGVHMFISFQFSDGTTLSASVQMRRRLATSNIAHLLRLFLNPSELIYIIATGKDMIEYGNSILDKKMQTYHINLEKEKLSKLFIDILRRANKLTTSPEFYSILSNNCINNVLYHIDKVTPINLPRLHYAYIATEHLGALLKKYKLVK